MIRKISAGAVIFRREKDQIKYLLLHYVYEKRPRHWDFPKGGVEKGEKLIETARRESMEETGIKDLKFILGFEEDIKWFFKRKLEDKKELFFKRAIFYLAETKTEEVKISPEHIDFAWLDYEAAIERLTFKNAKNILMKANNFLLKDHEL